MLNDRSALTLDSVGQSIDTETADKGITRILDSIGDDADQKPTIKAADLLTRMKDGYKNQVDEEEKKDGDDEGDQPPKQNWLALIRQQ